MKKLLLTSAALALSIGSAVAADLPSYKSAPPPPPPPPPPLWTGFYVGLNAGYTWSNSNTSTLSSAGLVLDPAGGLVAIGPATASAIGATGFLGSSTDGFIGGGQIGYNWQFGPSFVAGVEADIQGIAGTNSARNLFTSVPISAGGFVGGFATNQAISTSRSLDYLGTVRGRLGWLFTPTLLVYGTGGLAYGGVSSTTSLFGAAIPSPIPFSAYAGSSTFADTRVGWTAGGGVEWMFWPNWSAKVEYLYYDLGTVSHSLFAVSNSPAGPAFGNILQTSTRFDGHIVRAGVNYHFNWGAPAPVYAKY